MSLGKEMTCGALSLELASSGTDCANRCGRTGRYEIHIAGHRVKATNGVERYAYLCPACSKEMLRLWEELTGRAAVEDEALGVAA